MIDERNFNELYSHFQEEHELDRLGANEIYNQLRGCLLARPGGTMDYIGEIPQETLQRMSDYLEAEEDRPGADVIYLQLLEKHVLDALVELEEQQFGPATGDNDYPPLPSVAESQLQRELEMTKAQRDEYFAAMSEGSREAFSQRDFARQMMDELGTYIREGTTEYTPYPFEAMRQIEQMHNRGGYQFPTR